MDGTLFALALHYVLNILPLTVDSTVNCELVPKGLFDVVTP
ncbi:hypothetical protein JCM19233_2313 [Vibrio astriarenae]|nr:hypothetical protein JCM19233_2313 [Vibrio sp. C7]